MKKLEVSKKCLSLLLLVLLLVPMNFAYVQDDDDAEKKAEKLKADAGELLRETSGMIQTLSSPTNRINFTIKSADILWKVDETEARSMFNASIDDVKRLMSQIDIEANQRSQNTTNRWGRRSSSRSRNSSRSNVYSLRSSLISALSNHDPEWAMRLVQETSQIITNKSLVKRIERDNKRLEKNIVRKIAAKDVTKALELAKEKLSKGVTSEVISLLSQIYSKDADKGADFANDILQKLKSSTLKRNQTWLIVRLFQYGLSKVEGSKTPLFDKSSMTDLADLLATQVTNSSSRYRRLSSSVMKGLEEYSPNSAAQVKRTFEQRNAARNNRRNGSGVGASSRGSRNTSQRSYWEQRSKFQNELNTDLNRLGEEGLSSEDKQKIINEAKDKILSIEENSFRFTNLLGLALRANVVGEKELASNILGEAETLINQDPKEKRDFSRNRSLANAYASVDADKSFVILENMVYRLNDVINGYIKYMEFSGNGRVIENNELLMNSRNRQFTNYLRISSIAMKSLAESDYNRLKDLTDKFERPEIRIELRLLLAKGLLSASKKNNSMMFYSSPIITTSRIRSE